MSPARILLIGVCLLFSCYARAMDLPCDDDNHPQICAFLNRYISELQKWNEPNVSLAQKMRDDKFVILEGSLENLNRVNESTSFSLVRYENKAYEVTWTNPNTTLLSVAFPIQYELILGMPQNEIERHMQEYISYAPQSAKSSVVEIHVDSIGSNLYCSKPKRHYQIPAINDCRYFSKNEEGKLCLINDAAQIEYTVANIFQDGMDKKFLMQVEQSIYGFKHLNYVISLPQWLNYCALEQLTCYVAVEAETDKDVQVLIVAENIDLAYNHLLSVIIPKNILGETHGSMLVKMNAFIPTHNITDLYEQYTTKPKNQREWEKE